MRVGLKERQESTHALRGELQKLTNEVWTIKVAQAQSGERERWIVQALSSVMKKVGANGVPPPPEH